MTADALLDDLRAALPGMRLVTDAAEAEPYRRDQTAHIRAGVPVGVAFPASTEDVSTILRLATEHRVPVVPRGAGTGLSGGAVSVDGALTVVLTGMDRILHLDPDDMFVVVQPGILNAALGRAVAAQGMFYPPDPASYETCSIGGNLAEDAGGLRCIKYGVTRDYVLGLEVVLADGAVIRTGGRTVKDAMGYDLTQLFVGSEGTLGIITEATLRLLPQPAPPITALAFFPSPVDAGRAVAGITRAGVVPVTLELMDRTTHPGREISRSRWGCRTTRGRCCSSSRTQGARRRKRSWMARSRRAGPLEPRASTVRRHRPRRTRCGTRAARPTGRSSASASRAWRMSACHAAAHRSCSPPSSGSLPSMASRPGCSGMPATATSTPPS